MRYIEGVGNEGIWEVLKEHETENRVIPTMKSLDGVNKKNDVNNTASEAPEKNVKIGSILNKVCYTTSCD